MRNVRGHVRPKFRAGKLAAPSAARVPLYRQIADFLMADVERGRYSVGQIMPSELELAEQLKVSRGSVRGALHILAESGVVERTRKVGTKVLRDRPLPAYVQRLNSLPDALEFGSDTIMQILDVCDVIGPPAKSLRDEISPTGYWLQITGTRMLSGDDDTPTTWAQTWVNGPFSGIRPLLEGQVSSVYKLIEKAYAIQIVRLDHKITAIPVPDYAALPLAMDVGAPALEVIAWLYADTGDLVEFVRSIHNPARFSMEFSAESLV